MKIELAEVKPVKGQKSSEYTWVNIKYNNSIAGKIRIIPEGNKIIIFSINVFPEYRRKGIARSAIYELKKRYNILIADSVRHTAREFWERIGFRDGKDGNYYLRLSLGSD